MVITLANDDEMCSWSDHDLHLLIAESNQFIFVPEYNSSLQISSPETFGTCKDGHKKRQPENMLPAPKRGHKI